MAHSCPKEPSSFGVEFKLFYARDGGSRWGLKSESDRQLQLSGHQQGSEEGCENSSFLVS